MPNPSQSGSTSKRKLNLKKNKAVSVRAPENQQPENQCRRWQNPPDNSVFNGVDNDDVDTEPVHPPHVQHGVLNLGQPAIVYAPIFQGFLPNPTPDEDPIVQTSFPTGDLSYLFPTSTKKALCNFFIPATSPHRQYIYQATPFSCMQFVVTQEAAADRSPEKAQFSLLFQTPIMDGPLLAQGMANFKVIAWKCSQSGIADLLFDVQTLLFQCLCTPQILILMNTGGGYEEAQVVMEKLRYSSSHVIPPMEATGAIWIFWNRADVDLDDMSTDQTFGHLKFIHPESYVENSKRRVPSDNVNKGA